MPLLLILLLSGCTVVHVQVGGESVEKTLSIESEKTNSPEERALIKRGTVEESPKR